jgi:hypothetical protein
MFCVADSVANRVEITRLPAIRVCHYAPRLWTQRAAHRNEIEAAMICARTDFANRGWNAQRSGGASAKWPCGFYFPGGRYLTVFFVAWSTSSGVISTVARDATAPLTLTANERAAASTLLGRSAMITKSLPPKA